MNDTKNNATEDYDYTLDDLLKQALDDESWEANEEERKMLTGALKNALNYL